MITGKLNYLWFVTNTCSKANNYPDVLSKQHMVVIKTQINLCLCKHMRDLTLTNNKICFNYASTKVNVC